MADLTVSQIVERAASELGKKATGQSIKGSVSSELTQSYQEVWKMLHRKGLVTWSQTDDVPEEYCNPIVFLTAAQRLSGVSNDRFSRISTQASRAVNIITSLKEGVWINPTEVQDY